MIKIVLKIGLFAVLLTCLVSCSPVKLKPPRLYLIDRVPRCVPMTRTQPITLLVQMPETMAVYDTTRMAYTICPHQIAYFIRNQWAVPPAQMLQPLIVQTLQDTHHYHAIITQPFLARYDYVLATQILKLHQNFRCCPPLLHFTLRAQIISVLTSEVIATDQFAIVIRMPIYSPYGGVLAANVAAEQVLQALAEFSIRHTPAIKVKKELGPCIRKTIGRGIK